jgi:hypothetical protein
MPFAVLGLGNEGANRQGLEHDIVVMLPNVPAIKEE